ncbi:hypothetical protein OQA88_7179 [Cercophora sp. LCS_1]
MTDFRDVTDFFAWFGNKIYRPFMNAMLPLYPPPKLKEAVMGVYIRCEATAKLNGGRYLERTMVDSLHPIRGLHHPPVGIGDVLAVRVDDQDLSVPEVIAMLSAYCDMEQGSGIPAGANDGLHLAVQQEAKLPTQFLDMLGAGWTSTLLVETEAETIPTLILEEF